MHNPVCYVRHFARQIVIGDGNSVKSRLLMNEIILPFYSSRVCIQFSIPHMLTQTARSRFNYDSDWRRDGNSVKLRLLMN